MSSQTRNAVIRIAARAFYSKLKNDGRPALIAHFITNRCMCHCPSCLWKHNDWEDVPLSDLQQFYLQARKQGFVATAFTGGEPFLRKDLGEIVRFVKHQAKMNVVVFTTGWFLERRMHEVLPHIDMLIVSVDSANGERHDEIRGKPGLFDRLVRGIERARAIYPKLPIRLNTCVQQGMVDEVDDLVLLAHKLGVRISFDVITEFRNGDEGARFTETQTGLPLPELQDVCRHLILMKRQDAPILNSERYFQYFVDGRPGYNCHHPKLCMSVDGRGFVENCLDLDHPIANIREKSLAEIMELPRFKQLRIDAERCSTCSSPTMIDMSHLWENPLIAFQGGGINI
jgi:MoaA/NifB/PqqE/SkfB family radical SAM enzyme